MWTEYGWVPPELLMTQQFFPQSGNQGGNLASQIDLYNQQLAMSGQAPIAPLDSYGDPKQYLQMLAASNPDLAQQFASPMGLDVPTLMQEAEASGYYERAPASGLFGKAMEAVGDVGNFFQENPALFFGLPFAVAGATGAFGAGGATTGTGSATASGSTTAAGLTPAAGGATTYPLAAGGPISVSPLAGAGGAGAAAAGVAADGLAPIAVGASRLPGGNSAVEAAINSAWGGGGGVLQSLLGGMSGNWGPLIGGLLGAVDANNQPDSMTTNQGGTSASTYGQTLPSEITGPASEALASLRAIFGGGAPVAGVDPASMAAISGLQGFAGGGGINPYLDTVFNSAADATRNRLTTEFARSGRNLEAALPSRSEDLQHLAASIYGPGFEAERQRQFGALGPLLAGGDYLRSINQQQLDAPLMNFQRYMSGIQGLLPLFPGTQTQNTTQTGSVTQPLFNNPWAGFLGGAQLGSLFQGA